MIDTKTPEAAAISKQEDQAGAGISQQKQQNFASQQVKKLINTFDDKPPAITGPVNLVPISQP